MTHWPISISATGWLQSRRKTRYFQAPTREPLRIFVQVLYRQKLESMAYIFAPDSMGLIFIQIFVVGSERRIGRSRSSKVVDFGTNRKGVYDFLLVLSYTVSGVWRLIGWKLQIFYPLSFNALDRGEPFQISGRIFIPKATVLALSVGEDFVILACVAFTQYQRVTDGQTDRVTDKHSDDG